MKIDEIIEISSKFGIFDQFRYFSQLSHLRKGPHRKERLLRPIQKKILMELRMVLFYESSQKNRRPKSMTKNPSNS